MIADITHCSSGFSDRLRLITFYAAVALCRNDKVLYIKETPNEFCPFRFTDLCEVEGFTLSPWNELHGTTEEGMREALFPSIEAVQKHKPQDIAVSNEDFLVLWLKCYQRLKPIRSIQDKVNRLNAGSDCLGLHIRYTDKIKDIRRLYQTGFAEIHRPAVEKAAYRIVADELDKTGLKKVFVAADHEEAKVNWVQRLRKHGCQPLTHPASFDISKLRQTSGEDFVVDLFSLARCRVIVGTTESGVVRSALWISGSSKEPMFIQNTVKSILAVKKLVQTYQGSRYYFRSLMRRLFQRCSKPSL